MAPALFLWAEEVGGDVDLGMSSLPTPMCPDRWGLGLPSLQANTPVSEALVIQTPEVGLVGWFWSCPGWEGLGLREGRNGAAGGGGGGDAPALSVCCLAENNTFNHLS